ncbi:AroM family protein [Paenibacillus alginolyticus]|uniref:AroM family protein n=1 Tax=Paenibacillus alginolyticus TaxID=59839 RepID=A0ABT4GK68_9BACL|nr:aspartate/glutamate racemase family protein [Paenibacillus alginolyticus]MCY9670175.1 AroM family protein [Paenibacillus alginolyticus]MCY9696602.1 AroM family protein [Paenibacillus alginolyticus]MEC0145213.1 AroM family protein [Paenibacillus alginolyticus]
MIGLIRVFTTEDSEVLEQHGQMISKIYGVPVINKCIPDQPLGIFNNETEEIANPKIVELGKSMEKEGCKLLIISCAADPAIEQLRKSVSIPVIGAGSAASLTALAMGQPVGVMGISDCVPAVMENILGNLMVQYIRPEGVTNTTDLMTAAGREKAVEAARKLLDQGTKVIVFACTGFSTIGLANTLRKELNVPVIDAVEAEGLFASNLYKQFSITN